MINTIHTWTSREVDLAVAEIQNLKAAIAEARTQITDFKQKRDVEMKMLASLKTQPKIDGNKEYQRLAARACRAGIKAWDLSIVAFEKDIVSYQSEIDEILEQAYKGHNDGPTWTLVR